MRKQRESMEGVFLRLSVEPGGCSGFQYQFNMESMEGIEEDDACARARPHVASRSRQRCARREVPATIFPRPPPCQWKVPRAFPGRSVFERDGAKVVVDEGSLALLDGSTIDFEETMMSASFVVLDNPQSGTACGCGTSFQAKDL